MISAPLFQGLGAADISTALAAGRLALLPEAAASAGGAMTGAVDAASLSALLDVSRRRCVPLAAGGRSWGQRETPCRLLVPVTLQGQHDEPARLDERRRQRQHARHPRCIRRL